MAFHNRPELKNEQGEGKVKRYVHQELTVDHYTIRGQILKNGRVKISGPAQLVPGSKDDYECDTVEVPASFIFKLASALKMTRSVVFVSVEEGKNLPAADESN